MDLKQKIYKFLRKSEKYTKTDNIYLAKGGFWLSLKQIGTTIIALGLAMVWARFIPKEIYGKYKFVLSVASFLVIFSLPGMATATTQAVARGFDKTIEAIVKTKFKWSILGTIAGFSLAFYYLLHGNQTLAISFLIVGIFSPFVNSFIVYGDYLTGKKRFDLQAKYGLSKTFLRASATITAILLTRNVIYLILVYFAVQAGLSIFFYILTSKKLPPTGDIDPKTVSYGKHLSLIGVLGTIATNIDKILVFHFLGAVELAIYSFAILVPNQIKGLSKNIGQLALPKFAVRDNKEIKRNIWSKTIRMGLFLIIIVVLYMVFAGLIFKLFFPAYMDSVLYTKIYSLSILGGIAIIPDVIFRAKAKTKIIYKCTIFNSLIKILILFVSLYYFGLLGLIIGYVIQQFVAAAIIIFMFRDL